MRKPKDKITKLAVAEPEPEPGHQVTRSGDPQAAGATMPRRQDPDCSHSANTLGNQTVSLAAFLPITWLAWLRLFLSSRQVLTVFKTRPR